jgi:hypothetical protein
LELYHTEIINIAVTVLVALTGLVTKQVVSYLKKKGLIKQIESHKALVEVTVNAVEQTYKHLHGRDKLQVAKEEALKLAKAKKVKISENEIDLLIESVVGEMNRVVKEETKK